MIQIAILSAAVAVALGALAYQAAKSTISAHRARQRRWQERRLRILVERAEQAAMLLKIQVNHHSPAPGFDIATFILENEAAKLRQLAGTRR